MKKTAEIFCDTFCHENADTFANLFTDNATYTDCLYGKFQGKEAIKSFHKRCHQEAYNYKFSPILIMHEDSKVFFEWKFSFNSLMPYNKDKKINIEGCSIITLVDEKIAEYKEYTDSIAILLKINVPDEKIIKFFKKKYSISDNNS